MEKTTRISGRRCLTTRYPQDYLFRLQCQFTETKAQGQELFYITSGSWPGAPFDFKSTTTKFTMVERPDKYIYILSFIFFLTISSSLRASLINVLLFMLYCLCFILLIL